MQCVDLFNSIYKREPNDIVFCPYRVCPIGAHSDHNLGKITGITIDKGIHIAFKPKMNGVIEMTSLQFEKRAQWHISSTPDVKQGDWADYLRGATIALAEGHRLTVGICGVIEGDLPIGGLSSSAAVTIAFLIALCKANGIVASASELVSLALEAENKYVGVACGKLDQSCEIYCKKDHLLYLDTLDDSYELIPTSPDMKPYRVAVFFSGLERSLTSSKFNMRVDEARSAAYALKAYAGIEYGKFGETNLREVPREVFEAYKDRLPDSWRLRAQHWYTEFDRVEKGAALWRAGDLDGYGALSFESGRSSIESWQTGSPELIRLYELMTQTDGIYGGRFSGAGFNGCCMALIDPAYEESIAQKISSEYLKSFPMLESKFSVHFCDSADGTRL